MEATVPSLLQHLGTTNLCLHPGRKRNVQYFGGYRHLDLFYDRQNWQASARCGKDDAVPSVQGVGIFTVG